MPSKTPDVLVTGSGRSGTSFTAYVLQTFFPVCMGMDRMGQQHACLDHHTKSKKPIYSKPRGGGSKHRHGRSWEDPRFRQKNWGVLNGNCTIEEWVEFYSGSHEFCNSPLIGYKHPTLVWFPMAFWEVAKPKLVIHCIRNRKDAFKSLCKWTWIGMNWTPEMYDAYEYVWKYELVHIPGYMEIDFTNEVSVEELRAILKPKIEEVMSSALATANKL